MAKGLRRRVYQHMQQLPLSYHYEKRRGEVLTLLSNDSERISEFVTETVVELLPLIATFVGAFLIMAWIDPVIALLVGVMMPGVLVEVAFISNPKEEEELRTHEFRQRIAEAIALGVETYKTTYESRIGLVDRPRRTEGRGGS